MTYAIAHSVATDVANSQMKANRRNMWNVDDYNLACRTLARLFPKCGANPNAGLRAAGQGESPVTSHNNRRRAMSKPTAAVR